jgi:outer membrane protein TolC
MQLLRNLGVLFVCLAASLKAQPVDTNSPIRSLSLDDCVRLAVEHNLNIQIERFNPNLNRFTLDASYGLYDPILGATYRKQYSLNEGSTDPNTGLPGRNTKSEVNTFTPDLRGTLPLGLTYDLLGNFQHRVGEAGVGSFDDYSAFAGFNLRQPLLRNFWTDEARTQIKINKQNLKISEWGLIDLVRRVVSDVQRAYYELIFSDENVKVQEDALGLAQRLVLETKKKVEVGTLAPLEEKRVESDAARIQADLISAKQQRASQENILKSLVTDNYEQWHEIVLQPAEKLLAIPETYNLSESWLKGLTLRPDFKQLQLEVEKQGVVVRLRFNQLFPALDMFGGYGQSGLDSAVYQLNGQQIRDSTMGGALDDVAKGTLPSYNVGAIFTFPLSSKTERSNYKGAKELKRQVEMRLVKLHQDIIVQIDDAVKVAQSAFQRVDATRQATLFAKAALDAEQKKLESGKSTPFLVQQAQRDLTSARGAEIRALADYNQAISDLHFKEGSTLERSKVTIEFK